MTGPQQFRFLNEPGDLGAEGWDNPGREKLWRYNLHYFDDLNARASHQRSSWHTALLADWIRENPPGQGTGWEPYPTSRRIVNWVKWALQREGVDTGLRDSLAIQARWLSRRLETHILGNHLFTNAKALIFAGLFFEDEEAEEWLKRGLEILGREVPEQILPDGGHFERSPMYHALALEDLLDLINLMRVYPDAIPERYRHFVEEWGGLVAPMLTWLDAMSHPDGDLAFFNDAAMGIAQTHASLDNYASRLGFTPLPASGNRITNLAPSGYVRLTRGSAVAMLDVAPVGPDYLPGHAHADTLSFELSLFGQRVFVNSGISCYGTGEQRLRERGTPAHNTVVVDNTNSSEVWLGFRVARRARPVGLVVEDGDSCVVQCSHDGYDRLPGRVRHTRRWVLEDGTLVITDELTGRYRAAQARFHLHPSIRVEATDGDQTTATVALVLPAGQKLRLSTNSRMIGQTPSTWHPEFGVSEPNLCLVMELAGAPLQTCLTWNTIP
ncbi:MAG: alginate lyase family protein [Gemmatimonadales bacterium]|nr:alginate lyase family protein [Gemmatimonadales bacterium]MDZ4390376.1 alginate lyase family protein [Gemmatimonadales bacterium]